MQLILGIRRMRETYQLKCHSAGLAVTDFNVKEDTGAYKLVSNSFNPCIPPAAEPRTERTLSSRHDYGV